MARGIIAYSFGRRDDGASCLGNIDLAAALVNQVGLEYEDVVVIAQAEVADAMPPEQRSSLHLVIAGHRFQGCYLDSAEVTVQAAEYLRRRGVRQVIIVAKPRLHLWQCRRLARKAGLRVVPRSVGRVRFDEKSNQWWTRGPVRLLLYAVLQVLFGRRGR